MLGETFELTREDLERQRPIMFEMFRYMRQRNVDRVFLPVGKYLRILFAMMFWLLVVIFFLEPALALFLGEPIRWSTLVVCIEAGVTLRILMLVCRRSLDVSGLAPIMNWLSGRVFKKILRRCPVQVTWKLEGETFDYKGRKRHVILKRQHLVGQDVKRIGNWIGITAGLRPKMYTFSTEAVAIEAEAALLKISGESVATPPKRVSLWLLIGALLVGVVVRQLL